MKIQQASDLSWMETRVDIDDLTLAVLPPGEVEVCLTPSDLLLDFNLAPHTGEMAIASDKFDTQFMPAESMAYWRPEIDHSLKANNALPGLVISVGDKTLTKWMDACGIDKIPDEFVYKTDLIGSKIAQAAILEVQRTGQSRFGADLLTVEAIVMALSTRFMSRVMDESDDSSLTGATFASKLTLNNKQVNRAKDFIAEHLSDPKLSIAEVAAEVGRSSSHFAQIFKDQTGMTPYNFILQTRMERAQVLVSESTLPLSEVAHVCGFADQAHMTATFRKRLGTTPGKLRRENRPAIIMPVGA